MKNVYFLLAIRLVCSLKLLVPIEFSYSSSLWTTVINTKTSSQNLEIYVIVNPNATPVTSLDANYQTLMISLNAAGIKILGNIDTVQCANSQTELQTQVDNWISYYGTYLYGFYFNNLQSQSSCIPLASSLASYAHNKGKKAFGKQSVFNYTEFNGVLDVIVYEGQTYPTIPAKSSTTSRLLTGVVIHSQALDTTSINSICTIADFIFISDESGPSPYSTLGSQFSSVASSVNSLYFNPSDDLCYATNCPSEFTADNVFKTCNTVIQEIDFTQTDPSSNSVGVSYILMVSFSPFFGVVAAALLIYHSDRITGIRSKKDTTSS